MKVIIEYNLPDDIETYKRALKDLKSNPIDLDATDVRKLRLAIINYMLVSNHDNLIILNQLLELYQEA